MSQFAYSEFIQAKHGFFASKITEFSQIPTNYGNDFKFLFDNNELAQQEYDLMISNLDGQEQKRKEYWLWCYFCADLLHNYYTQYRDETKAKNFADVKTRIIAYTEKKPGTALGPMPPLKPSFVGMLWSTLKNDLNEMFYEMPQHSTKIKSRLGDLNFTRLYLTFLRLSWVTAITWGQKTYLLEYLNEILGRRLNTDAVVKILQAPAEALRFLSVAIFALRFTINLVISLKHTITPSEQEKAVAWYRRFYHQLRKLHASFLNDLIWGMVNLLANYASLFNISAALAGWMTAGFLLFDVGMFIWLHHLAKQDYTLKKQQLRADLLCFEQRYKETHDPMWLERHVECNEMLNKLEIEWQTTSKTYLFYATAAMLVFAGFTAAMMFATGIFAIAAYLVGVAAMSLYMSANEYGNMVKTGLILEQVQLDAKKDIQVEEANYLEARNHFIGKVLKTMLMPSVFIVAIALSWEIALLVSVAYLSYQLGKSYLNHRAEPAPVLELQPKEELYEACPCSPSP